MEIEPDSIAIKNEKTCYSVVNNYFETQQMVIDTRLKELDQQWSEFLEKDPYLKVAYDVMLLMIK